MHRKIGYVRALARAWGAHAYCMLEVVYRQLTALPACCLLEGVAKFPRRENFATGGGGERTMFAGMHKT